MSLVNHGLKERDGTMTIADVEEERIEHRILLDGNIATRWMKL